MSASTSKEVKSDQKSQLDRFKETARELGCDETGEAFEKAFIKVAPPRQRKLRVPKVD